MTFIYTQLFLWLKDSFIENDIQTEESAYRSSDSAMASRYIIFYI